MNLKINLTILLGLCTLSLFAQEPKKEHPASLDLIQKGIELHNDGKYKEAIALYKQVSKSDTNYVWAIYELGLSYNADSNFTEAKKMYELGLSLETEREREPDFYNNYGSLIDDLGDSQRALRIYDSAIAKYPAYSQLRLNKATTLIKLDRIKEAESILKENILMDPYSTSSHYLLGYCALKQGKIVQSFISNIAYLMMNPSGRFQQNAINGLNMVAKSNDEVAELIAKRTEGPTDNFQLLEQILLSKIALDKNYKPLIKLDDPISRQIQVLMEKAEYNPDDDDFWMHYYIPLFRQLFDSKKFEPFIYHIFSNINIEVIQSYNKKNKKESEAMVNDIVAYLTSIKTTRALKVKDRENPSFYYTFEEGKLTGKGYYTENGEKYKGAWEFYYSPGNIRSRGKYNDNGEREGEWTYFYFTGAKRAVENYSNGKVSGPAIVYFENGNVSSKMNFNNDEKEGTEYTYFLSGAPRTIANYKNGKLDGTKTIYYKNKMVEYIENYKMDSLNGEYVSYHQNGELEYKAQYVNGDLQGYIKGYHNNKKLAFEGAYKDGKQDGKWKRYHKNGALKTVENYVAGELDGEYLEYYDDGTLSSKQLYKAGKTEGQSIFYDIDGKQYAVYEYEKNKLRKATQFDKAGKQISSVDLRGRKYTLPVFHPDGAKKVEQTYNDKGDADGPETFYFKSGAIMEKSTYIKGYLEGTTIGYHPNGTVSAEINYHESKQEGANNRYYINGKLSETGWNIAGEQEGEWLKYDEMGNLESNTHFYEGDLHGWKTEYWPNGKVKSEKLNEYGWIRKEIQYDTTGKVLIVNDFKTLDGKYQALHFNGKLAIEATYDKGNFNGNYNFYYFDGSPELKLIYKNGLLDSTYVRYSFGNKKSVDGKYKMGDKIGTWTYYKPNGKINFTEKYENGELNGERIYYHDNGKIEQSLSFKDDEKTGWTKKFDSTGVLIYQIKYENSIPVSYSYLDKNNKLLPEIPIPFGSAKITTYYPNGKISASFEYKDGKLIGANKTYYPNGQVSFESNEVYSLSEGLVKEYHPNGQLKSQYTSVLDNYNGPYALFNSKGVKIEEGFYYNDNLHGKNTFYDDNGKVKEVRTYYYGELISVTK